MKYTLNYFPPLLIHLFQRCIFLSPLQNEIFLPINKTSCGENSSGAGANMNFISTPTLTQANTSSEPRQGSNPKRTANSNRNPLAVKPSESVSKPQKPLHLGQNLPGTFQGLRRAVRGFHRAGKNGIPSLSA